MSGFCPEFLGILTEIQAIPWNYLIGVFRKCPDFVWIL